MITVLAHLSNHEYLRPNLIIYTTLIPVFYNDDIGFTIFIIQIIHIIWSQTKIQLKVAINPSEGSAVLDFEGTGWEIRGNLNAPISVVHSAVIYCMRSMLNLDIPLNAGCLVPLDSRSNQFFSRYSVFSSSLSF